MKPVRLITEEAAAIADGNALLHVLQPYTGPGYYFAVFFYISFR
jgi:hypothetical protein